MRLIAPYHYGNRRWDNYLLEIQDKIQAGSVAHQQGIQAETRAHDRQIEELRQHTEQIRRMEGALNSGFEELRAEFEWGFTLIADSMQSQIEQLSQIAAQLDAIHKTLQSPLLTQARELFLLGQAQYQKGLLDKALEAYLKAEEKYDVDFPLQFQIGKLYLYGRDEDDNVMDFAKAEKHLLLAARYVDAEKSSVQHWDKYCGEAWFHAAVAAYLVGEQEQAVGRMDSMRSCLERALRYLSKASVLLPRFTEIVYTQAKCHALLGQSQDVISKMVALSDRDRRYLEKATLDGDFESMRSDLKQVFEHAIADPGPLARATLAKIKEVTEALGWAKRSAPSTEEDLADIESSGLELTDANRLLYTLEVDIEGLANRLAEMRVHLDAISLQWFKRNIDASERAIVIEENRKSAFERSLEGTKKKRSDANGSGLGIGCLAWIGGFVLFGAIGAGLESTMRLSELEVKLFLYVLPTIAAIVAWIIKRHEGMRGTEDQRQQNLRGIEQCNRSLPFLQEKAEVCKKELKEFEAWLSQHTARMIAAR